MINSLLYVGLLCMGVGAKASTPINLIDEPQIENTAVIQVEKNYANQTPYNFEFGTQIINHWDNTNLSPNTPANATSGGQLKTGKTKYYADIGTYVGAQAISYASNYRTTNGTSYTTQYAVNIDAYKDIRKATCGLLSVRLTPYMASIDNELKIKTMTSLAIPGQPGRQFVLRNEYYITQDQGNAEVGWDISNWTTQYQIYDTFDQVGNQFYTGNYFYVDYPITASNTNQIITSDWIDVSIPVIEVNGNRVSTYLYVRSTCYLAHEDNMPDILGVINVDANEPIRPATGHRIRGTGINAEINYEYIDLPGLLWEILSMPFSFISTAFNLTLFPNTPYQVNISNLILMIFGILVFLFIFKLLLKR